MCLAHVRKDLARRSRGIEGYAQEKEKLREIVDLEWDLARQGEAARKLKAVVIDMAQRWRQVTCFLLREGVPGTNNACERAIGRSKTRADQCLYRVQYHAGIQVPRTGVQV